VDGGNLESGFVSWDLKRMIGLLGHFKIPVPEAIEDSLYSTFSPYEVLVAHRTKAKDLDKSYTPGLLQATTQRSKEWYITQGAYWIAEASANRELLHEAGRSTRHIEIPLPPGKSYVAGDHLGVVAANAPEVVCEWMEHFKMPLDSVVMLSRDADPNTSHVPLMHKIAAFDLFGWFFELQAPASRSQIRALSKLAQNPKEAQSLRDLSMFPVGNDGEDRWATNILAKRCTLLEILKEFKSIEVDVGTILAMLPEIKPRYYSISSSPKHDQSVLSISVSVVKGISPKGRNHFGVASNFIKAQPRMVPSDVAPGYPEADPLLVFIKDTGSSFRLPPSPDVPVIMIGPGTGVAPMRGFIQERVALGAKENILFFGCRSENDFLYKEELEVWMTQGFLKLFVAFSRKAGAQKKYVQQVIKEQSLLMVDYLKRGACVYVCGDASKMAPDVKAAFVQLTVEAGLGDDFIPKLASEARYCEDVWATQSLG